MNIRLKGLWWAITLGWCLLGAARGAESDGVKPSSVVHLADLRYELAALQTNISASLVSLHRVQEAATAGSPLGQAVGDFCGQFILTQDRVEAVRRKAVVVKARVKSHYDAWGLELTKMQNPQIRAQAGSRITGSKEQFARIIASADEAKKEALPFVSDLKDVMINLEADPSEDAVKLLAETIAELDRRSLSVVGRLREVDEQIERTIQTLPQK